MCQCVIKSNISWLCVFVCVYIIRLQQMQHHLSAVTLLINSVEMLPATRLTNTQPTPQTQVNIKNHHRWHRFTGTAGLREGFMYQSAFTHINLLLWQIMHWCTPLINSVQLWRYRAKSTQKWKSGYLLMHLHFWASFVLLQNFNLEHFQWNVSTGTVKIRQMLTLIFSVRWNPQDWLQNQTDCSSNIFFLPETFILGTLAALEFTHRRSERCTSQQKTKTLALCKSTVMLKGKGQTQRADGLESFSCSGDLL